MPLDNGNDVVRLKSSTWIWTNLFLRFAGRCITAIMAVFEGLRLLMLLPGRLQLQWQFRWRPHRWRWQRRGQRQGRSW